MTWRGVCEYCRTRQQKVSSAFNAAMTDWMSPAIGGSGRQLVTVQLDILRPCSTASLLDYVDRMTVHY